MVLVKMDGGFLLYSKQNYWVELLELRCGEKD